jgi:A/G-specific adenine glycosylase
MHRLSRALLRWYRKNKRELPWRGVRDPYAVWVSEVMLQQTRAETVAPYYDRWMRRFPTVASLAGASERDVLRLWEGLGYYRRALALREGAHRILRDHAGRIPEDAAALARLPGIGAYTAAAIAALAFDRDEVALDGNLRRVLSRLMNLDVDPRRPEGERRVLAFARRLLPPGRAADFNQGLMDLGSSVCVAGQPRCGICPLRTGCAARRAGVERQRPVRARPKAVPQRIATAGVLRRRGRVLIARRPLGRLLGGLWEFPGGKRRSRETIRACLRRELREELGVRVEVGAALGTIRHTYSHFSVTVHAFECHLDGGEPTAREHQAVRWVTPSRLEVYPMGKVARTIARKLVSATQTEMSHRSPRRRREKPSTVVKRREPR